MKKLYRVTVPVTITVAYVVHAESETAALAVDVDLDEMFLVSTLDALGPHAARADDCEEITDRSADWDEARASLVGDDHEDSDGLDDDLDEGW